MSEETKNPDIQDAEFMETDLHAEAMASEMGGMVHALFSMPVHMRMRAVDALAELVGVSREEARAEEVAAQEAEDAKERNLQMVKITLIPSLVQMYADYLKRPVEHYPPPPEAVHAHPSAPVAEPGIFDAVLNSLSADQRKAVWALLHEDQRALVRQFIPGIDALVS